MNEYGAGQWKEWHGSWGIPFIWTANHVFGGNLGIKGNLTEINQIPFAAPPIAPVPAGYDPATQAVGVGYTPEGLDQNPACECILFEGSTPLHVLVFNNGFFLPLEDTYCTFALRAVADGHEVLHR